MARFFNLLLCLFILFAHLIAISLTSPTHHSIDSPSLGASLASYHSGALAPRKVPQIPPALARREATSVRRADDWIITYLDGGLWKLWFAAFQGILRIANAALVLEHFLQTVLDRAEGIWLSDEPVKAFTVELGILVLEVICEIPIPWGFIGWVAETLLHRVSLGFVGTFKAMVEHISTRKMVHINLKRIADAAAAA